ncbi:MAG: addiction module protein [Nitrospirae bacterium]|nr:addiction module protein [Nitrospirota bacterium]
MKSTAKRVLDAVLRLDDRDKLEVAEELLSALEGSSDTDVDTAWAAEVERRSLEISSGEVETIPWSTVRKSASQKARGQK